MKTEIVYGSPVVYSVQLPDGEQMELRRVEGKCYQTIDEEGPDMGRVFEWKFDFDSQTWTRIGEIKQ